MKLHNIFKVITLQEGYKLYLSLFRMDINYTFFYSTNPINTSILKIN